MSRMITLLFCLMLAANLGQAQEVMSEDVQVEEVMITTYPNPASTSVHVIIDDNSPAVYQVQLFDVLGNQISSTYADWGHALIDVSDIPRGVYFCAIEKEGKIIQTRKLVVQHG